MPCAVADPALGLDAVAEVGLDAAAELGLDAVAEVGLEAEVDATTELDVDADVLADGAAVPLDELLEHAVTSKAPTAAAAVIKVRR
jgi:hypothetical protein